MEVLFNVKHATVSKHISSILASGELAEISVGFSDKRTGGRKPKIFKSGYNKKDTYIDNENINICLLYTSRCV